MAKAEGPGGTARRGARLKPVSVFQLHWGWSQEKAFPAFPDAHVLSVSLHVWIFCVCVSVWFLLLVFFFFNKEKKMCIFLAMTET